MKRLMLILLLLIPTTVFAATQNPGIYRWNENDGKDNASYQRKAVDFIDIGEVKISADLYIHSYTLLCVDGVKVLTTFQSQGANSTVSNIIIPGPCSGPMVEQKKQEHQMQQVINHQTGKVMVDW